MLFQDDAGGLQVENPKNPGSFIDATPMKNALVMNVGDLLMRWSNGASFSFYSDYIADLLNELDFLKSTLHRVTLPPVQMNGLIGKKLMTKSRYSIPYFVSPDPQSVIQCLSVCTNEENPPKYEPVTQEDYRRMRAKGQYVEPPAA